MHEVAASRRKVWFALLLAATFVVALSVGLTATPSSHPLRVEAAGAATPNRPHAHRASATTSSTRAPRSSSTTAPTTSTTAATSESTAAPTELASTARLAASTAVAAPTTTARVAVAPTTTAAPAPTIPPSAAAFLACIRQRESHGNYRAVSSNGLYRGAYQFTQSSWDMAAAHAGRHDLVGVPPDQASPAAQDAVALALYEWMGAAPWGGACT